MISKILAFLLLTCAELERVKLVMEGRHIFKKELK